MKAAPKLNGDAARTRLSSYPHSLPALLQNQLAVIEVSDMRDENSISMDRILCVLCDPACPLLTVHFLSGISELI